MEQDVNKGSTRLRVRLHILVPENTAYNSGPGWQGTKSWNMTRVVAKPPTPGASRERRIIQMVRPIQVILTYQKETTVHGRMYLEGELKQRS